MACVLSLGAAAVTALFTANRRLWLLVGTLVFSHWLVDFITQPMRAAFPGAGFRMRVFFTPSPTIEGFGRPTSSCASAPERSGGRVNGPSCSVPGGRAG